MVLNRTELKRIKKKFLKQLNQGKKIDEIKVLVNGYKLSHIGDNCFEFSNQDMFFEGRLTNKEKNNKKFDYIDNELAIRVFDTDDIQFTLEGKEEYYDIEIIYLCI